MSLFYTASKHTIIMFSEAHTHVTMCVQNILDMCVIILYSQPCCEGRRNSNFVITSNKMCVWWIFYIKYKFCVKQKFYSIHAISSNWINSSSTHVDLKYNFFKVASNAKNFFWIGVQSSTINLKLKIVLLLA